MGYCVVKLVLTVAGTAKAALSDVVVVVVVVPQDNKKVIAANRLNNLTFINVI